MSCAAMRRTAKRTEAQLTPPCTGTLAQNPRLVICYGDTKLNYRNQARLHSKPCYPAKRVKQPDSFSDAKSRSKSWWQNPPDSFEGWYACGRRRVRHRHRVAVATLVMGLCVAKRRSGEKGVDGDTQCHAEVRRSDPENEH